ncbi:hypothetical protein LTR95_016006, partial [Oleoguttula sp. CCFEE 5521]
RDARTASLAEIADSFLAKLLTQGHAKNCSCGYCDPDPLPFAPCLGGSITDSVCYMLYPLGSDASTDTESTPSDAWEDEADDFDSHATEDGETEWESEVAEEEGWTWASASEVDFEATPMLVATSDETAYEEVDKIGHFVRSHGWNALFNDAVGKCAAHAEVDDWSSDDDDDEEQWESAWDVKDAVGWEWAL